METIFNMINNKTTTFDNDNSAKCEVNPMIKINNKECDNKRQRNEKQEDRERVKIEVRSGKILDPNANNNDEIFCKVSDEDNKPYYKDGDHHFHCKRFKPKGTAPPFPPQGGNITLNDGASSISSLSRSSLLQSSALSTISLSDNQASPFAGDLSFTRKDMHTGSLTFNSNRSIIENEKVMLEKSNSSISENEGQASYSTANSPDSFFEERKQPLLSTPDVSTFNAKKLNNAFDINNDIYAFFPQFSQKKRERKFEEKENCCKLICKGCQIKYNKLKRDRFCHNCFKIYEAVGQIVNTCKGSFKFNEASTSLDLTCSQNHSWSVDFKTKQVKKWCRICKKSERDQRKEYYRRLDEEKQREFERMQRDLFNEAKTKVFAEEVETNNQDKEIEFLQFLIGEESEDIEITEEMMFSVVNYIINEPEINIQRFFEQIRRDRRMRAFRRIARIVHPDKNPHLLAKEAFQKLLSSSSSLRSPSQSQLFCCGFLYEAEEMECFGQPLIIAA